MTERTLSEPDLAADPVEMFSAWFREAVDAGEREPEAMALATAGADGMPSVRFVLLKSWDRDGFVFYTNQASAKGRDLRSNPRAALALRWALLERQVRVAGRAEPLPPAASDAYFATRARRSQLGAWASEQSAALSGRDQLERRLAEVTERFEGAEVPRPPWWGGWRVAPDAVEFWQGRDNRLHDRFRFERGGDGWRVTRLSP